MNFFEILVFITSLVTIVTYLVYWYVLINSKKAWIATLVMLTFHLLCILFNDNSGIYEFQLMKPF